MSELERAAAQRKAKLDENSAFLQFNWKADVVESWIGMKLRLESSQSRTLVPVLFGLACSKGDATCSRVVVSRILNRRGRQRGCLC